MPDLVLPRHLLAMRYRLLWAQTRTRNGKIALFVIFYLAVVCGIALLALGGFSAGIAAVRAGRAELAARILLGGIFANALVAGVILGFGMNAVFSDAALRRYPLSPLERLLARQASALLEPLWLILLALDVGLAVAFSALGVCPLWAGVVAAVLLLVSNYLLARVLLQVMERLIQTSLGVGIVVTVIMAASMLPAFEGETLARRLSRFAMLVKWTPPVNAASVLAGASPAAPLFMLAAWCLALAAVLLRLERHPLTVRAQGKTRAEWDTLYDRVAAWFGPRYGPVAGKTLRYYLRSNRVRYNLFLAIPMLAFFSYTQARTAGPMALFASVLSAMAAVGFVGTAVMAVNQFGYDEGGFRRYFLLPAPAGDAFRASTFAALFLSLALVPPSLLLWAVLAPLPTSPLMWLMLLSSALGGALFFNAAGIWTSLYSPRKTDITSSFGNNLSFGGNVLVIGGMLPVMFFPAVLRATGRIEIVLHLWWIYPLFCAVSAAFYCLSLSAGAHIFESRRERLLGTIEGRD